MQKKDVHCPLTCSLCDTDIENAFHVFVTCLSSQECWQQLGLRQKLEELCLLVETFSELFFLLMQQIDHQQQKIFDAVWNDSRYDSSVVRRGDAY